MSKCEIRVNFRKVEPNDGLKDVVTKTVNHLLTLENQEHKCLKELILRIYRFVSNSEVYAEVLSSREGQYEILFIVQVEGEDYGRVQKVRFTGEEITENERLLPLLTSTLERIIPMTATQWKKYNDAGTH